MSVRVLHGDCRELMAEMPDESVDHIFADPPYGETSIAWDRWQTGWLRAARRVLKRTGSLWCFGTLRMFMGHADEFSDGWNLSHDVIWEKQNGSGLFNDRFRKVHEQGAHFYRSDAAWADVFKVPQFTNDATARTVRKKARPAHWIGAVGDTIYRSEDGGPRLQRSVIYARNEHARAEHPTQKPYAVVAPLLAYACPPGGTVLDPFAGSGTTGLCAKLAGQNAILMEADGDYIDVIHNRLTNDAPLFAAPTQADPTPVTSDMFA